MPLAIVTTSDTRNVHGLLLSLNFLGVLACVITIILLILTAVGMIFEEPNVNPVILEHISKFNNGSAHSLFLRESDYYYSFEDPYMAYLSIIDMLSLSDD